MKWIASLFVLFALPLCAQVPYYGINPMPFPGVPTGNCGQQQTAVNTSTGDFYTCKVTGGVGSWNEIGGGGGGGAPATCVNTGNYVCNNTTNTITGAITFQGNNTHSGTEGFTNDVTISDASTFPLQVNSSAANGGGIGINGTATGVKSFGLLARSTAGGSAGNFCTEDVTDTTYQLCVFDNGIRTTRQGIGFTVSTTDSGGSSGASIATNGGSSFEFGIASGSTSARLIASSFEYQGSVFTVSGCGTPIAGAGSGAASGWFTAATASCAPTITFGLSAQHGAKCALQDVTTPTALFVQSSAPATPASCAFALASGTPGATDVYVFSAGVEF